MKFAIVYSSPTGNTKQLAEGIESLLGHDHCFMIDYVSPQVLDADVVFVGFWTLKGTFDQKTLNTLQQLKNKKIFLFGTAGFGQSSDYFAQIIERGKASMDPTNCLIGSYMCQGKMPDSVKMRYESMLKENDDEKTMTLLENFEEAVFHPNQQDVLALQTSVNKCLNLNNTPLT